MAHKNEPDLILRLFLVRHGETWSNIQRLVAGQAESPLTTHGKQQAIALGASGRIKPGDFWRLYSSDLQRAQETARLILEGTGESQHEFLLDPRLRELAKGALQGYPKSLADKEAIALRRKEAESQGIIFKLEDLPLVESEIDGYSRFYEWLFDVVRDAVLEHRRNGSRPEQRQSEKAVLLVSHSALLRSILTNLFPKEVLLKHGATFDSPTHLVVPNTSLTILDIVPRMDHESIQSLLNRTLSDKSKGLWEVKLIELHWTGHYDFIHEHANKSEL